jgi:hypothetical protein
MAMKKLTYLIFALVSTMFLAVGATRAAENFDSLGQSDKPSLAGPRQDGPCPPCVIVDQTFNQ